MSEQGSMTVREAALYGAKKRKERTHEQNFEAGRKSAIGRTMESYQRVSRLGVAARRANKATQ